MSDAVSIQDLAAQILPCDTSKPYAFVSYSKQDYAKVYPCIIALQQSGCNIWVDKNMEEQADQAWTRLAFDTIQSKNCVAIIFMISKNSLISVPCFNEILYSQKGQIPLNRHRNNPVKLITVNADSAWNPRRKHFSQWVYDVSDQFNDDAAYGLSTSNRTLLEDLGRLLEPKKSFNIPTSGDVATAFMNEVYGSEKEIDRTTVLPIDSTGAIMKNISETMDKPEIAFQMAAAPAPAPAPAAPAEDPGEEPPVREAPAEPFQPEPQNKPTLTTPPTPPSVSQAAAPQTGLQNNKVKIGIAAGAVVLVLIILFAVLGGGSDKPNSGSSGEAAYTTVTDTPYTLSTGEVGTYTGKWLDDMPYESGTWTRDTGDIYEGEWQNGQATGKGKITWVSGNIYEGDWIENTRTGQGTMTFSNGDVYVGDFQDNERTGQGAMTYANGDVYEGEWANGKRSGQGTGTLANGEAYTGEWADDAPNGRGTHTFTNGDLYEGDFENGMHNGKGTYTFASGAVYEGEFKDGKFDGKATYTSANGDIYVGEYKDNKRNGHGTVNYANGDVFVGEYKDGQRDGHGVYTFTSGTVYNGEYKEGKRNGQGTLTKSDGTVQSGEWKDGEFIGEGGSGSGSGSSDPDESAVTVKQLRVYATGDTTAMIEWDKWVDGKAAKSFKVRQYKDNTYQESTAEVDRTDPTCSFSNLAVGSEYYISVQATYEDDGKELTTEWTNLTFKFGGPGIAPPAAPQNIKVEMIEENTETSTWDAVADATSYQICSFNDAEHTKVGQMWTSTKNKFNLHIAASKVGTAYTRYYGIRAVKTVDGMDVYSDWTYTTYTHSAS